MSVPVVVPARDEAAWLPTTLAQLDELGSPITVVDNASSDATAEVARASGTRVLHEGAVGKGHAVRRGVVSAPRGAVFLCDADVRGVHPEMVSGLTALARTTGAPVVRLAIGRDPRAAPVTTLTARPLLAALGVDGISEPLGGLVMVDRDFLLEQHLPGGWGFDVALTLAAHAHHGSVPELRVSGVQHRHKPLEAYADMAAAVSVAILRAMALLEWDHDDCIGCANGGGVGAAVRPAHAATL